MQPVATLSKAIQEIEFEEPQIFEQEETQILCDFYPELIATTPQNFGMILNSIKKSRKGYIE